MLRNYLTVAYRTLKRNKGYAFINIAGLAVGLAACLLIGLWVRHELSYDDFHKKADRIYRVIAHLQPPNGAALHAAVTSAPVGQAIRTQYPGVERVVRMDTWSGAIVQRGGQYFTETGFLFVDSTFFDVFTFPLLKGNPQTALDEPFSLVLTKEAKRKYFGDEEALGKVLTVDDSLQLTVTGIAENVPRTSHFTFNGLVSWSTLRSLWPDEVDDWRSLSIWNYVLLREGASPKALEAKIDDLIERHESGYSIVSLRLQPITDIYLRSDLDGEIGPTGNITQIYILSAIALFIMLIACVNYMNLATARSMRRAREVGIRKVAGAHRGQLIGQFLGESVLLTLVGLVGALLLARLALPFFNRIAGTALGFGFFTEGRLLLGVAGLALGIGLLAGSYPAVVLSSFAPARVLSGTFSSGRRGARFRQGLVVFQFAISVALIAGTLVVIHQLRYMQSGDLGFAKEQVLVIDARNAPSRAVTRQYQAIKRELMQLPRVRRASASMTVPGRSHLWTRPAVPVGVPKGQGLELDQFAVDYDFIETLGIEMAAGRSFSEEFASDRSSGLIINATAAEALGWTPSEAVGKRVEINDWTATIVGVMKDYHQESLREQVVPLALTVNPDAFNYFSLRITPKNISQALARLEQVWSQFFPGYPFDYFFLDEDFAQEYRAEQRLAKIFGIFAGLAILIACLGLFGLAAYTAERRTKEIGIRKVLGASVPSVVALLSKDFLKLVLVAFVIAAPVAYFAMQRWLQDFAYRIDLGVGVFLLAGTLALVIALLTVSYQAIKAALANPVEALRNE